MASRNPLKRFVQLILDRRSAKRTERDAQRALRKGTDPKRATKNLRRVEGGMARLRRVAVRLGGVLAATFGARALFNFGKEAVRVATEADEIWSRLAATLETRAGVAFRDVQGEIATLARGLQDVTKVGDEDFADILQRLVAISGDYEESLQNVALVADLAEGANIDFKTAAQLVGRAMVGETALLKRYGIVVEEGSDAVATMREQFGGLAEAAADSRSGIRAQIDNELSDLKQAIGDILDAIGGGEPVLRRIRDRLKEITQGLNDNREAWVDLGRTIALPFRLLFNLVTLAGNAVLTFVAEVNHQLATLFNVAAAQINFLIEQINKVPGINIDFRIDEMPADAYARFAQVAFEDMGKDIRDIAEMFGVVRDEADGAAESIDRAGEAASDAGRKARGAGGEPSLPAMPEPDVGLAGGFNVTGAAVEGLPAGASGMAPTEEEWEAAVQAARDNFATIENSAASAAQGVAGAWQDGFGLLIEGFSNVGNAALAVAQGIAGAFLGGIWVRRPISVGESWFVNR